MERSLAFNQSNNRETKYIQCVNKIIKTKIKLPDKLLQINDIVIKVIHIERRGTHLGTSFYTINGDVDVLAIDELYPFIIRRIVVLHVP